MTERDKMLLNEIITALGTRSVSPSERATSIVQQMTHWPGLASAGGWIIAIETLLADKDQLAAARARITELEQHVLMLTKLPAWKPVEDGYTHLCDCIDCTGEDPDGWSWQLYVNSNGIGIEDPDNKDDDRWVLLPDDVRLCRLTGGE